MDLGIKNKVALVAASSRGLGKAIAFQLSREGAKLVICARNKERLGKTRDEIAAETGGVVRAFVADVRDKKQVSKMVEQTVKELGTIEILVSNAGGPPSGTADDFTLNDYQDALELNL
ncbi:MAG: SDR family NAD(P)-dependent oxidoreductase, partial [Candidatus Aminicenantes bacterium]|nr:SDR family NAD(P)-dependent oxidoreductase [Candidatus Aminicenantes bacterium]